MKITFNIDHRIKKQEVFEKLSEVLFRSMIKMEELAVNNAPVDTGLLKSRINVMPRALGYSFYNLVAGVNYAMAVEFGTSPHVIIPITKKALAFEMEGKKVIVFEQRSRPGGYCSSFVRKGISRKAVNLVINLMIK